MIHSYIYCLRLPKMNFKKKENEKKNYFYKKIFDKSKGVSQLETNFHIVKWCM